MMSRLKEASKLGFRRAIMPATGDADETAAKLELSRLANVRGLAEALGVLDGVAREPSRRSC
jgi:predicted ATP-dependent serine protease